MTQSKLAAIYARISQDDRASGLGVARQEQDCRTLAAARSWEVGAVFIDNDVSAWKSRRPRPEYMSMMDGLRAGTFNALVVYNLDRLYRKPRELEDLIDLCEGGRISFATCAGELDLSTPSGITMARVQVGFAWQASADASRRQKRKMIEVAQKGGAHGGPRAYGVKRNGKTLDPHESAVIREVADAIIDGASLRGQCLKLNARGDHTPRGNQWAVTTLRRLLLSPRIIGQREHLGSVHDAIAPAIITAVQQAQIVARLSRPVRRGAPVRHLLSGILRCGVCSTRMVHVPGASGTRNRAQYACPAPPRARRCVSIVAPGTDEYVIEAILARTDAEPIDMTGDGEEDDSLAESIAADYQTLRELGEGIKNGTLSITMAQTAAAAIEARINESERALAVQIPAHGPAAIVRGGTVNLDGSPFHIRDYWHDTDVDERRWIIEGIVEKIEVMPSPQGAPKVFDPKRLRIIWR